MPHQGEDCYFYFYSTCIKGDFCPFRHCEAALGNETVCTLWRKGRCVRRECRFRHMEIDKKRSEIPCYWENQPTGCRKLNCAFHHNRSRYVDGLFLPPSKTVLPTVPESQEEKEVKPAGGARSLQQVHLRTLEEKNLEEARRMQQGSENCGKSRPQAEAAPKAKRLFRITRRAGPKVEENLKDRGDAPSQRGVTTMEANETSPETISDPPERPVNRCDTTKEKHTERQQEEKTSQKENPSWSSVLTALSVNTLHLAKWFSRQSSQKGEVETSGIGDSILDVKRAAQTLEERLEAKENVKPSVVKVASAPKLASKRKAGEMDPAVAVTLVKPFSSSTILQERPAKKAAVAVVPHLSEEKSVTVSETEKLTDSSVLSLAQASPEPLLPEGSGPSSSQMTTKPCSAGTLSPQESLQL